MGFLRSGKFRRLAHFLFLAVSLLTSNILSVTLAETLFLSNAGSERMPMYYVLLALISMPVAAGIASLVDRYSRPQLLRALLLISATLAIALRLLLPTGAMSVYYAVYICFSLFELLVDIVFWVLISDYFTSLDLKRYATYLIMAMSAGGLLGGGLASLLTGFMAVQNILLVLPALCALAVVQLFLLERDQKELGESDPDEEEGLIQSIKSFPQLVRQYPTAIFLAGGTAVAVLLRCLGEFQAFTVYSARFPDEQQLASFLGKLGAGFSGLEFLVTYFLSRPLIQWLGVGRMNVVYPATTLTCFTGLAFSFSLPMAVAVNLNYETLQNGLAQPVETLNYNAIPHRFVGRVRVIAEGLLYPAGMALCGLMLMALEGVLSPVFVTGIGIGVSVLYLVVGHFLGRSYLRSLVAMLRSRSVNLDEVPEGLGQLRGAHEDEIRQLLTSDDYDAQLLGVELAARINPTHFLGEAQALVPRADFIMRRSLVRLFGAFRQKDVTQHVRDLLHSESGPVRATALEALITARAPVSDSELRQLLEDPQPEVRVLACVAAEQEQRSDPELKVRVDNLLQSRLDSDSRHTIIVACRGTGDRRFTAMLKALMEGAEPKIRCEALEAIGDLADPRDEDMLELAVAELRNPEPQVRAAACRMLNRIEHATAILHLAPALEDEHQSVREVAAAALAFFGELSLDLACERLASPRSEVVEAAISTIGQITSRNSERVLYEHLQNDYQQSAKNLLWIRQLPRARGDWESALVALEDSNQRIIRKVLHVLSSLGHARTLNCVRQILYSPDERMRANAIETLASLKHRRFVEPILPLLEREAGERDGHLMSVADNGNARQLLQEMFAASDRWVRIGALFVASPNGGAPPEMQSDPDPLVRAALEDLRNPQPNQEPFMKRLVFLKKVPILQYLSLDDLMVLNGLLEQEDYLEGEVIFTEGALGHDLYIVVGGQVSIRKKVGSGERELARMGAGECFGEMALFDDAPRSATAVATSACTLLTLERDRFMSLVGQRPSIALQVCKVLSQRLRSAGQELAMTATTG
ncbi:MAG TPA: HEAT repeat domain-containing protein [Terriglobales bacterium]|nr:HEAT repeat domain-containing protein [Terriglobales bacterium]